MDPAPKHAIVTQERDGSLSCDCVEFDQTGKACKDIRAVRLQIDFGPVGDYIGKFN